MDYVCWDGDKLVNIFQFTDVEDNDKEYKYKILVYPNITFQKDLEKDSYVVVLGNIIRELNKIRDDLFFTIISPSHINSLEFKNTEQIIAPQIGYPNSMRMAFPFKEIFEGIANQTTQQIMKLESKMEKREIETTELVKGLKKQIEELQKKR